MGDSPTPDSCEAPKFAPRGYQQELLEESLRQNIIIALDTGSGKTHIAVLRMKHEVERNSNKISWFLAPTVALIEQQHKVISDHIPVSVGQVTGASEPDQWKDAKVWRKLIDSHRILVTTPQILLDALHHGYMSLGEIGLLVFDEAHHAISDHPYNVIMRRHYFDLPRRSSRDHPNASVRPMILGLTASPIYGGDIGKAFDKLEANLDSVIRSSQKNREELEQYVNRPVFKNIVYGSSPYDHEEISWSGPSLNIIALRSVISTLKLDEDPYVISLRDRLKRMKHGDPSYRRMDQKLSKTLSKGDTFTHKGLHDFLRAAVVICSELGGWAADWYVYEVIEHAKLAATTFNFVMASWREEERGYLLQILSRVRVAPPSAVLEQLRANLTPQVVELVNCLIQEEAIVRVEEPFSGIIFVTRRDTVLALSEVLRRLPETAESFRIGSLLGTSNSSKRHSFLDITRTMLPESTVETLQDFKIGEKNLIVSTAVAEEGIDIQACGCVIRFDLPQNMVSWAQSRGRARRKTSTLIMMTEAGPESLQKVRKWEQMEVEMMRRYTDIQRLRLSMEDDDEIDDDEVYEVKSTGAILTLRSAVSHLHHFCAVLHSRGREGHVPIFELDPPEFPEGWHLEYQKGGAPSQVGPWRVKCTLPRILPAELRTFTTEFHSSKKVAKYYAAFQAYVALHKAGQLNDHLLPLFSVIHQDHDGQVKLLLNDVAKRASVANVPIQMDPWASIPGMTETWWCSELVIGKFPALYLFTRRLLPAFSQQELPTLYVPGYPELNVRLVPLSTFEITRDVISSAQQYTRRMFSAIHGLRMDQNKLDFSYLFLPVTEDEEEARWDERRRWMAGRFARSEHSPPENQQCANAAHLMEEFGSTLDWAMVRENSKIQRPLRFIGWHDGPIEPTEEVDLRTLYDGFEGPITYPLLLAQKLPNRTNFLLPRKSQPSGSSQNLPFLLIPRYTMVDLISQRDVTFSQILPSLLRWLTKAVTVTNLRDILFHSSPLQEIPLHTLTQAVTAPMSQEPHYQRLETLGDTVLKYIVGLQLFVDYPTWHEGYLAKRKDHAVNNNRLALDAVEKELYRWIIRDRLLSKKWVPRYFSDNLAANVEPEIKEKDAPPTAEDAPPTAEDAKVDRREERRRRRKKQAHELSTKVLADVVEALIGASYEHGGFDLAVKCLQKFGLGIPRWETVSTNVSRALSLVEEQEGLPEQFSLVERMLGYQFKRRMLLVEALTHPTYQGDLDNVSYERLEFLGDSALDMVVTDFLYHAPGKEYTPGKMHVRKEGLVNSHFLAYICLRTFTTIDADNPNWDPIHGLSVNTSTTKIHLWKCLLHSSPHVLEEQTITFASFEKLENQILRAFSKSQYYPWALLTDLQAPKFISDMVESILGAVFLDSEGDLNAVKDVMKTLGMFSIMQRIVDADVYVLHPVSQLGIWAAQEDPQKKMRMEMEKKDGNLSCTIFMDDEEVAKSVEKNRGIVTRNKVRFAAADAAIKKLVLNEEESLDDVDDVVDDWGNAWTDGPVQYEW